ncbi:hypothetical protein BU16DRAFT_167014 [Lophium mytilinum]|uniref:Uncharacterized protein n=1 Tax=Lophium mytilinum TaxID=390894 RepID=A0A6A6QBX4_9PEZI|nr:hypothetical protein BU16DRAFT_167014 [Lophium mytilinum]
MEQGNRGRGRASVRQRWMAARARTGGGVSTRSGNVNRRGRGPAYPPNDAVDGQWAVVAEDAGSEPVMIQEEVHDDNDYGGDDRHGDDFCEQRMYEQYGEEYREQYGDGYEGDGSDESSTASSPTYDSPEQISTSAEE